jgi:hypothetical protein
MGRDSIMAWSVILSVQVIDLSPFCADLLIMKAIIGFSNNLNFSCNNFYINNNNLH